jgi:hypothetical protein
MRNTARNTQKQLRLLAQNIAKNIQKEFWKLKTFQIGVWLLSEKKRGLRPESLCWSQELPRMVDFVRHVGVVNRLMNFTQMRPPKTVYRVTASHAAIAELAKIKKSQTKRNIKRDTCDPEASHNTALPWKALTRCWRLKMEIVPFALKALRLAQETATSIMIIRQARSAEYSADYAMSA